MPSQLSNHPNLRASGSGSTSIRRSYALIYLRHGSWGPWRLLVVVTVVRAYTPRQKGAVNTMPAFCSKHKQGREAAHSSYKVITPRKQQVPQVKGEAGRAPGCKLSIIHSPTRQRDAHCRFLPSRRPSLAAARVEFSSSRTVSLRHGLAARQCSPRAGAGHFC